MCVCVYNKYSGISMLKKENGNLHVFFLSYFEYYVILLSRLGWSDFISRSNRYRLYITSK